MARHFRLPYAAAVLAVTCSLVACGREDAAPASASSGTPEPAQQAEPSESPAEAPTMITACDPSKAEWAIGETATDEIVERARADAGARITRVLKPNQPATMDYRPDRLDVLTDEDGVIEGFRCG